MNLDFLKEEDKKWKSFGFNSVDRNRLAVMTVMGEVFGEQRKWMYEQSPHLFNQFCTNVAQQVKQNKIESVGKWLGADVKVHTLSDWLEFVSSRSKLYFISDAFNWGLTSEGHEYWATISEKWMDHISQ